MHSLNKYRLIYTMIFPCRLGDKSKIELVFTFCPLNGIVTNLKIINVDFENEFPHPLSLYLLIEKAKSELNNMPLDAAERISHIKIVAPIKYKEDSC